LARCLHYNIIMQAKTLQVHKNKNSNRSTKNDDHKNGL
jgi:hypothetical protein